MINETLLQFDKNTQLFSVNQMVLDGIDFRALAIEKLFNKKYHYIIIKNFLDEYTAKNIREFYFREKSFLQNNKEGNHRLFYYLNSPYRYPRFITSLINHCMVIKNRIYEYNELPIILNDEKIPPINTANIEQQNFKKIQLCS